MFVDIGHSNLNSESIVELFHCQNTICLGLAGIDMLDIQGSRVANTHVNALDLTSCSFREELLRFVPNLRYCSIENTVFAFDGNGLSSALPHCYFDW